MKLRLALLPAILATAPAAANEPVTATLAGHAILPALSLVTPPADAPRDAWVSGKFTTGTRVDQPLSVPGDTGEAHGNRKTGLSLPFIGQPVQGISGVAIEAAGDGSIYALIDNGFGNKHNSADALLSFVRLAPDWETGAVEHVESVFLRDPDRVIPFRIIHEGSDERYLTGGDFDPESIQIVGDTIWIGEEFGPYLLSVTLDGVVTGVHETMLDGEPLRSPDHPSVFVPAEAGIDYRVQRSGGFEGMAFEPETGLLWAMLEKPLLGPDGEAEGRFLNVLAFDPASGDWTGESFRYPLDEGATAIGDFNFIDGPRALVIERDDGEGDPGLACEAEPADDCFPVPALFKRVVLIDTADRDEDGTVRKIAHIDLMDIADPDGIARTETDAEGTGGGSFTFPFFTIESVRAVDDAHILVANDNNLPFSSGRRLDQAADNEFILLHVPELLGAE